jgi:hypothetical protein
MKENCLKIPFLALCSLLALNSYTQNAIHHFKITAQEISTAPISPLLYGNFIELGYGNQVEPMWSEMFFNRSFEHFNSYKSPNKDSWDLYYDKDNYSKGYEKDWAVFDWYHSGYEHNAWFAAPGNANNPSFVEDSSSFFITTTPERKIVLAPEAGGSGHGAQCLKATNNESTQWAAIAQGGKLFHKGASYRFRGMIKAAARLDAEIRFYPQGKWDKPVAIFPLKNLDTTYSEQSFEYSNNQY